MTDHQASPSIETGMQETLRGNIESLTRRRRNEAARAPWSQRIADAITGFTGSMTFVAIHLSLYGLWILVNLGWLPLLPRFDPTFVVLAMVASVEAIFLSTFVLISQNRESAEARRRAELDLHINLLAEHELTKVADMVARIARRLEIDADAPDYREVTRDVQPTQVMDALDARRKE
ncbi:DUF1003 domain-containing protein [Sphingomonas sp. 36D10-4-7]|uniref:DUF1003 domain-containing protein n=2 Tax=Sphingomonas corticis TaxID=2722791 RepID=A0ABX1CT66_9SPHN|nr:DUF1003 domain-containing protein [Sphingomonas corticis]